MVSAMAIQTLLSLLLLPVLSRAQSCYFPDGTPSTAQADDWTPCDPNASVSACCESTHVCLSNGLCLDTVFNHVVRGACTDSTFSSYFCPQFCQTYAPNTLSDMRQCDGQNDAWTCGLDPSNCDSPFSVPTGQVKDYRENDSVIAAGPASGSSQSLSSTSTSSTSTASSTSAASTSTDTAASQSTAASTPSATSSSTSATTVGLGAGLGVGLPLLIALLAALFFLYRARKEIKQLRGHQRGERGTGAGSGAGTGTHADDTAHRQTEWTHEHKPPAPQYQTPTHSSLDAPQQQVWEAPNRPDRMSRAELQS